MISFPNAKQFLAELDKLYEQQDEGLIDLTEDVTLDLILLLYQRSPYDLGALREGWQVGVGSSPFGQAPKGTKDVVFAAKARLKNVGRYETIFIVNNVEYAYLGVRTV